MSNKGKPRPEEKAHNEEEEDLRKLLSTGTPTFGDYRESSYSGLVHKAADMIFRVIVETREKDRHRVGFASCCRAWGEMRRLEQKGHNSKNLKEIGAKKELKITTKTELLDHITGAEPYNRREAWLVQFPRIAIQCVFSESRPYSLVVVVD